MQEDEIKINRVRHIFKTSLFKILNEYNRNSPLVLSINKNEFLRYAPEDTAEAHLVAFVKKLDEYRSAFFDEYETAVKPADSTDIGRQHLSTLKRSLSALNSLKGFLTVQNVAQRDKHCTDLQLALNLIEATAQAPLFNPHLKHLQQDN